MFSNALASFARFAPCSHSLVPFERFASLSEILWVCPWFSNALVSFKRFAPCSHSLVSFERNSLVSNGLLLVLKFSSLFRAARHSFSDSCVSFERFVFFFLSFSSGLLRRLKLVSLTFSSHLRAVWSLFSPGLCALVTGSTGCPSEVAFGRLPLHAHVLFFFSALSPPLPSPAIPCHPLPSPPPSPHFPFHSLPILALPVLSAALRSTFRFVYATLLRFPALFLFFLSPCLSAPLSLCLCVSLSLYLCLSVALSRCFSFSSFSHLCFPSSFLLPSVSRFVSFSLSLSRSLSLSLSPSLCHHLVLSGYFCVSVFPSLGVFVSLFYASLFFERFSEPHTEVHENIIFSSFCIFVPLPLAAPVSSRTAGREMKKQ